MRVRARLLIAPLAILLIAGCHPMVPRPGKPTAAPSPERPLAGSPSGLAHPDGHDVPR